MKRVKGYPHIKLVPGKKGPGDKVVLWNNEPISVEELAVVCVLFSNNEDGLFPKSEGFDGGDMVMKCLQDCMQSREVNEDILKHYKVKMRGPGIK